MNACREILNIGYHVLNYFISPILTTNLPSLVIFHGLTVVLILIYIITDAGASNSDLCLKHIFMFYLLCMYMYMCVLMLII